MSSSPDALVRAQISSERTRVLQLMKAIARGHWLLVAKIVRSDAGWSSAGLLALQLWLEDVLAGTERFYSPAERYGLDRRIDRSELRRAQVTAARPRRPSLAVALTAMVLTEAAK